MHSPNTPSHPTDERVGVPPVAVILEPDLNAGRDMAQFLRAAGIEVQSFRDPKALLRHVGEGLTDVAILDEGEERANGLMERLTAEPNPPATIVVSSFGTVEGAVNAMRAGASHFCSKPVSQEELVLAVRKTTEARRLRQENRALRGELAGKHSLGGLKVRDPRMREIFTLLETVAQTRATVLLLGESGTGKSVLARAVHQSSPRRQEPFVEVNCGALPDSLLESELFGHAKGAFTGAMRDRAGRFEAAHGGTIFLDEIGTASPSLQVRLLRVLQEKVVERVGESRSRNVDVRVILATNHNLENAVKLGTFREDLYYRIHVVAVEIPPLRDRRVDIPELAKHFLDKAASAIGKSVKSISPAAMQQLCALDWPGNVRELENAMERAVAVGRGDLVEPEDLAGAVRGRVPPAPAKAPAAISDLDSIPLDTLESMLAQCERRFLERALAAAKNNRTKAAEILGLHRATLYERMRRIGMANTPRIAPRNLGPATDHP